MIDTRRHADAAARPPVAGSRWLNLYSLVLAAAIMGYYCAILAALFPLVVLSALLVTDTVPGVPWLVTTGVLAILGLVIVRAVCHVASTFIGLVTHRHDEHSERELGVQIGHDEFPALHRLVGEVADRTGGPTPDEIRVTQRAECYVVEMRRLGVSPHRRLILVLGLPHLAALRVDELQVILAHELAHFSQGDTRLGVFVYRFLESLRSARESLASRPLSRLDPLFWFCRGYFRLFLALSTPIRVQQELRADGVSAAAYGGDLAARTLLKEWLLTRQFENVVEDVCNGRNDVEAGPDDVLQAFRERLREFSPAGQEYLLRRLDEVETESLWGTHPSIRRRVETARSYPSRRSAQFSPPATSLLEDYPALEHRVARHALLCSTETEQRLAAVFRFHLLFFRFARFGREQS